MNVGEKTQHAITMRGPVRARVDVYQLITRVRFERSSFLLKGAKAGGTSPTSAEEVRHGARQKFLNVRTIAAKNASGALRDFRLDAYAGEPVIVVVVADVLSDHVAGQLFPEKFQLLAAWERHRGLRKVDDLRPLELVRQLVGTELIQLLQRNGVEHGPGEGPLSPSGMCPL